MSDAEKVKSGRRRTAEGGEGAEEMVMAEPAEVDQQLKKHRMMLPNALRIIVLPSCLTISMSPMDRSAAAIFRGKVRSKEFTGPTAGFAPGFVQTNFVALPKEHAFDFLAFCLRNPRSCPLIEVLDPGDPEPRNVAAGADVRTDMPGYRIYRYGELAEEVNDITSLWTHDMVGFLLGCSFSWEEELVRAGCAPRHVTLKSNVPMYVTNRENAPAGVFKGKLVVSMRPYKPEQIALVTAITSKYPLSHGAPIHSGDPKELGIESVDRPCFGDAVPIYDGELPVFWACGVTPQTAIMEAKIPLAITHAPGYMFVTDIFTSEISQ